MHFLSTFADPFKTVLVKLITLKSLIFVSLFQGCINIEGIMEDQQYFVISNDGEELTLMDTE